MVDLSDVQAAGFYYLVTTEDPRVVPKAAFKGAICLWIGPNGGIRFQKQDDGLSTNWTVDENQGPPGTPGSRWFNGAGAPSPLLGINHDYYLDVSNGDVYEKLAGIWTVVGNIKGPAGSGGGGGFVTAANSTQLENGINTLRALGGGTIQILNDFDVALTANKDITNITIQGASNGVSMTRLRFTNTNYMFGSSYTLRQIGIDPVNTSNAPFRVTASTAFITLDKVQNRGSGSESYLDLGGFNAYIWATQVASGRINNATLGYLYAVNNTTLTMLGGTAEVDGSSQVSNVTTLLRKDIATRVGYTPANPLGWINPVTLVSEALNDLNERTLPLWSTVRLTPEGGIAIRLTNKSGAQSQKGRIVRADTVFDNAVSINPVSGDMPIGVFYDNAALPDEQAWVVMAGIADVLLEDNIGCQAGDILYQSATAGEAGYAGAANTVPSDVIHFREIGHSVKTVAAGGVGTRQLTRAVLHFN